jgi:protoporphyrin/coproporphyrin ferrochelatase
LKDGRAILLVGFGGPARPADVRPFLDNVLRGRPVPKERYEEVVRQYESIGGASPFNALTLEFARALEKVAGLPVYAGMRHWEPYVGDVMARMKTDGAREAAVVVLSSFRSEPGWDRYAALAREKNPGLDLRFAEPWGDEPRFARAMADRVRAVLQTGTAPSGGRAVLQTGTAPPVRQTGTTAGADRSGGRAVWEPGAELVFTAHSIPLEADRASDYSGQLKRACARTAAELGAPRWRLAYQSRSGRPEDPWLEPDVGEALREAAAAGAKAAVAAPIGFLVDHVEVLYDLDVKARAAAEAAGLRFLRARTVGAHPAFLELVAERAKAALETARR